MRAPTARSLARDPKVRREKPIEKSDSVASDRRGQKGVVPPIRRQRLAETPSFAGAEHPGPLRAGAECGRDELGRRTET